MPWALDRARSHTEQKLWIIHIAQKIPWPQINKPFFLPRLWELFEIPSSNFHILLSASKTNGLTDHENINKAFSNHLYDRRRNVTDMFMWAFYTFAIITELYPGLFGAPNGNFDCLNVVALVKSVLISSTDEYSLLISLLVGTARTAKFRSRKKVSFYCREINGNKEI